GDTTSFVTVIYKTPTDAAAFETYYNATHLPLVVSKASEIGFTRAELSKFDKNLDGTTPPAFYRQAKLYFPSAAALKTGTSTPGFKAVGDNLPQFATGGLLALIGHITTKP
ncbi:MAG: EthD family reductase, partial [Gemmatimonadota bacterium]